jgi:hypothetical protein
MNFTLLPDELLSLIILRLNRYWLSAFIVSSKLIYERCRSPDLLLAIANRRQVSIPAPLLVIYDYSRTAPLQLIPVYINGRKKMLRFDDDLEHIISSYFAKYHFVLFRIKVIQKRQIKYISFKCEVGDDNSMSIITGDPIKINIQDSTGSTDKSINSQKLECDCSIHAWLKLVLKEKYHIVSIRVNSTN